MPRSPERAALRQRLAAMKPGDAILFPLPDRAFPRRERYRAIAGVAHFVFGPGKYRIRMTPDGALLWRPEALAERQHAKIDAAIATLEGLVDG